MSIFETNKKLARTMNFGLALDAPQEGEWGMTVKPQYIQACFDAGFTAIRLPVQWASRMQLTAPYTIHIDALERVTDIVDQVIKRGMSVIVTNHPDETLMAHPKEEYDRFIQLWTQLSEHFSSYDDSVFFEPLSEPHDELEGTWNSLFKDVLSVVRRHNPTRPVIVGGVGYNRATTLSALSLPSDAYLIATFHYYLPIEFTMQGEEYLKDIVSPETIQEWKGTKWDKTSEEWAKAQRVFKEVHDWSVANGIPIFLGEFGVSDNTDDASKSAWITAHRKLAETYDFSWSYWSFGSLFSAYDLERDEWNRKVLMSLNPKE